MPIARWLSLLFVAACGPAATTAPPENQAAPTSQHLIFRDLSTGLIVRSARRTTIALDLDGEDASVTWTRETGRGGRVDGSEGDPARWTAEGSGTLRGTLREGRLTLYDSVGDAVLLDCTRRSVQVAAAGAVIAVDESAEEDCPGDWRWEPDRPIDVVALVCEGESIIAPDLPWTFATPSIEHVYENSDCTVQDGGLRLLAD